MFILRPCCGRGTHLTGEQKVEAIRNYPQPTTKKQVHAFLGLAGYYQGFIPHFSHIAMPLTDLTKKLKPDEVLWTEECQVAFDALKEALSSKPVLHNPDFTKPFILQTDASDYGIGAVLSQLDEQGQDYPISYFSKKLLPRE